MEELKARMEAIAAEAKERMEGLIPQTDQVPLADKYEGHILYCGNGIYMVRKDGQWVYYPLRFKTTRRSFFKLLTK